MVTGAVKAAVSYRDLAAPSLPPQGRIYPARLDLRTEICDGFRVLAAKHRDKITLVSRRGTNLLPCYPEIGECLKALPDFALDGELVILDEQGRPQLERLRRRLALKRPDTIARASVTEPAAIVAFDLMGFKGKDLRQQPQ